MNEIRPPFADFPQVLPCLTLWPEWAYAVKYYGKPVENRSWPFPKHLAGGWLGIHAGKKIGGAVMNERDGIECMLMTAQHAGYHFADKTGLIRTVMDLVKAESSRLVAVVRLASAKPPEFYDLVEKLAGGGPYAELFGRKRRPGWFVAGNDLPALAGGA